MRMWTAEGGGFLVGGKKSNDEYHTDREDYQKIKTYVYISSARKHIERGAYPTCTSFPCPSHHMCLCLFWRAYYLWARLSHTHTQTHVSTRERVRDRKRTTAPKCARVYLTLRGLSMTYFGVIEIDVCFISLFFLYYYYYKTIYICV